MINQINNLYQINATLKPDEYKRHQYPHPNIQKTFKGPMVDELINSTNYCVFFGYRSGLEPLISRLNGPAVFFKNTNAAYYLHNSKVSKEFIKNTLISAISYHKD